MKKAGKKGTQGVTTEDLLDFFLKLYKIHLGAVRGSETRVTAIGPYRPNPRLTIYELGVLLKDEWVTRRVTLGRIAEDTGSKSTCFFAIFDSKLVIKIPPSPVKDFETYLKHIERDKKIAALLKPRECLIPNVSAILSRVHKFPRDHEIKGEQREALYYEWLRYSRENQVFLKVAGNFAFFMDLSRHMFLPEVLDLFLGRENRVQEEITHDPAILDQFERFEGRYGLENIQIGVELKDLSNLYESRVCQLFGMSGVMSPDMLHKSRKWFFRHIAGLSPVEQGDEVPEERACSLENLLKSITDENRRIVDEYKAMIAEYLQRSASPRQALYMEGLMANILEMLAYLKDRGVAIRDIKPDNLMVAGDQTKFPVYLAAPDRFSIGLIDFETAVIFKLRENKEIEQPALGGTPPYATPANIFPNNLLVAVYNDLSRALYLQDWYAVVAMLYRIITGTHLFSKTSGIFAALPGKMIQASKSGKTAKEIVKMINTVFWQNATSEFSRNIDANRGKLASVRTPLMDSVREMLTDELALERNHAQNQVKTFALRQTMFRKNSNREAICNSTPEQMARLVEKAAKTKGADRASVTILKNIYRIKARMKKNLATQKKLENPDMFLSADELLCIMFERVVNFMYRGAQGEFLEVE